MCAVAACACQQRVHEGLVLLAVERAVQIIAGAVERFIVARGAESDGGIHAFGVHDGADGVVEVQPVRAGEPRDGGGQRVAGERAGGDDRRSPSAGASATSSRRSSMSGSASMARVTSAANASRSTVSAWPPGTRAVSAARSSSEPSRRSSSLSSQGADSSCSDFSELLHTSSARRPVWWAGRGPAGAHLVERHGHAQPRNLPGGFRPRQPSADNVNRISQALSPIG